MKPNPSADEGDKAPLDRLGILNELFERAHVSIWACDADGMVVLWNPGAEALYGLTFAEAQVAPYWDLFVDAHERDQAVQDTAKVVRRGTVFKNQLAYDTSDTGFQRHMLTNCFRVTDPTTGEHYLAEIGVEISDLDLRKREHGTLREVGAARLALHKNNLELRKQAIAGRLQDERSDCRAVYLSRREVLQDYYEEPTTSDTAKVVTHDTLRHLDANWARVRASIKAFEDEMTRCKDDDDLLDLEDRLDDLNPRHDLLEGLR